MGFDPSPYHNIMFKSSIEAESMAFAVCWPVNVPDGYIFIVGRGIFMASSGDESRGDPGIKHSEATFMAGVGSDSLSFGAGEGRVSCLCLCSRAASGAKSLKE